MKLPYAWLIDLVKAPGDVQAVAAALARRGFEVASIDGDVIDFEITANRPDCLSITGLAREASAAFGVPLRLPDRAMPPAGEPSLDRLGTSGVEGLALSSVEGLALSSVEGPALSSVEGPALSSVEGPQPIDVTIDDPELCPRYCAQVFEVRANGHTPDWMRERLEACGVRSISPIVDVTNYVMLETGQPTHAFDYAKLAGRALRIRRAAPGEMVRTLDGVDRALDPGMLVIADAERPQAVAGVMGGAQSEIGAGTTLMVLESACFKPSSVRRSSKKLGLKTEASTRFERGADIDAAPAAIARIAALLQQIGAAQPLGPTIDRYPAPRPPLVLPLRASRITRVLGMPVAPSNIPLRLEPLGFSLSEPRTSDMVWQVTVPTFRVDVQREIDLIEEIARHDGYASLPATFPTLSAAQPQPDPRTLRDRRLRQLLTACGLSEAMTFSFIEAEAAEPFATAAVTKVAADSADGADHADQLVRVANPLSEKFAVLRPSVLPGLIDAAAHNRRRQHPDVRLFETGARFDARGESGAVAGIWAGAGVPPHWSGGARPADFYDVKGVVETLARAFGVDADFEPADVPYLVPGQSASVIFRHKERKDLRHGVVGQIQPAIAEARGFPANEPLWAFELDADALGSAGAGEDLRAESLPRFPSIVRDLSVLVDAALPAAAVRGTIRSAAPSTLVQTIEFDRYTGKGVPEDRVSLSLRLTFRSPERTLTDTEVDAAMDRIVSALAKAHGALRR